MSIKISKFGSKRAAALKQIRLVAQIRSMWPIIYVESIKLYSSFITI